MKLLLLLILSVSFSQSESGSSGARPDVEIDYRCLNQTNFTEQEMQEAGQDTSIPDTDEEYGKLFACIWKGRRVMNENGLISAETLERDLEIEFANYPSKPIVDYIVDACRNVQGKTEGQTAIRLKNCIVKAFVKVLHGQA